MRQHCLQCFRKHLGNAAVLLEEYYDGYRGYAHLIIGNLDQAAQEIRELYPELATLVRAHRIRLQNDWSYSIPFEALDSFIEVLESEILESMGFGEKDEEPPLPEIPEECYKGLDRNATGDGWELFEGDQR